MLILLANIINLHMANFLFCRYHFVPAEEPDLFAQEDRTDASRDLYEFKTDKAGVQTSVQYEKSAFNNPDAAARLVAECCSREL